MMLADVVAGIALVSLVIYALLGGADFGGGVWDLFARGPRADRQREAIARAIGPIWEANHVWLILVVVLLFTCFPPAFSAMMIALHIPVAAMLVGIVLRGSSFVFRTYDSAATHTQRRWGRIFAYSSVVTPVLLGVLVGAISAPGIGLRDGVVTGGFVRPWLRPFPLAVGALALAQFAFLAATYLTVDVDDDDLREDFRRRALAAAGALALTGAAVLWLATSHAPTLAHELLRSAWSEAVLATAVLSGAGAVFSLLRRRFLLARALAAGSVALMLSGWGLAMRPWIIMGELRIDDAAAPDSTLRLVLVILALGALILLPALFYLYRTFKGGLIFAPVDSTHPD